MKPVRCLSDVEADTLLEPDAFPNTRHGKRDRALVLVCLVGGLRGVEARRLAWADVCERRRGVTARNRKTKSGDWQTRFVPLDDVAWDALMRLPRSSSWVFPGKGGEHLTARGVHRLVNDASVRALGFKVTPHMLRHTCATRLVRRGTRLDVVQSLLGHADISTTGVYLHPTEDEVAAAVRG